MTRRLCVVSRSPLMSGVFVAGLTTAVGSRDELEIIVDRRRGGAPPNRLSIERRHRDHVARSLERDGFAFVPMPTVEPSERSRPKPDVWPIEPFAPAETYEHQIEHILRLKRRRIVRLSRWLILSALMNAMLVALFLSPAVKARLSQARPAVSPSSIAAPVEKVVESPSPKPAPAGAETVSPRSGPPSPETRR